AVPGVKWLELHAFHFSRMALPGRDDRVGYSGPKPSALTYLDRRGPRAWSGSSWAIWMPSAIWPTSCSLECRRIPMLQLFDLARENAELKSELTRIRQEAETLHRLLADSSVQSTSGT